MNRLSLLFIAACASGAPFRPTTISAPANDPLAVATRVLVENGEAIDTRDDASGVLSTRWVEESRLDTPYHYRWTITVAAGKLTVGSQCQAKYKDSPLGAVSWKDCTSQPEERNTKAKAIADAIASAPTAPVATPAAAPITP